MNDLDSDDEENIIVRRPRVFRDRISYRFMETTYEFNERFRLSFEKFNYVLLSIEQELAHPTRRNNALTPAQQLMVALHWLGSGMQYHCAADMHGVSKATVCRTVHRVVSAINTILLGDVVRWPDDVGNAIHGFNDIAGLPLVCGAVDGTLIKVDAPNEYEPAYVDRHGNHSVNIMLVCGPSMHFYYVCANWPGSVSDARVLRNSTLCRRMDEGWRPFPGAVLLGDSIYPLKSWLIPPILRNEGDPAQLRFLRAHKQTRRVIECAIGIAKEKFPCLNYLRLTDTAFACEVIKCCIVLCNLSKRNDQVAHEENVDEELEGAEGVQEVNVDGEEKLAFFYNHFRND